MTRATPNSSKVKLEQAVIIYIGILDLMVTSPSELLGDVKVAAIWATVITHWWSSQSSGMWVRQRVKPGPCILGKQTFSSLREVSRTPWETALKDKGADL